MTNSGTDSLPIDKDQEIRTLSVLGCDTLEHALKIKFGVHVPDATIDIIRDREEFIQYTQVPQSVPEGLVLIRFEAPSNKWIDVMHQASLALNRD